MKNTNAVRFKLLIKDGISLTMSVNSKHALVFLISEQELSIRCFVLLHMFR